MEPIRIHQEIWIQAPAAHVWNFIGTEEGLRQWWSKDLSLEAAQGGRCEERAIYQGMPCHLVGEVTTYEPPSQLALFMRNVAGADAWPLFTSITITLAETIKNEVSQGENHAEGSVETVVTLVHQAFGPLSEPEPVVEQTVSAMPQSRRMITNQLQPTLPISTLFTPGRLPIVGVYNQWLGREAAIWDSRLMALIRLAKTSALAASLSGQRDFESGQCRPSL